MSQTKILDKEFISISELMELFSISRATAQRLIKNGEVQSQKIGGKVIIPTVHIREKFNLK
jgi:excisionase family DNA binding protein